MTALPPPTPANEWAHLAALCRRAGADLEQARRRLVPGAIDVPERIGEACDLAIFAATTLTAAAGRLAVLAERRERHEEQESAGSAEAGQTHPCSPAEMPPPPDPVSGATTSRLASDPSGSDATAGAGRTSTTDRRRRPPQEDRP